MEGMSEAYWRTLSTVMKREFWRMSIWAGRFGGLRCSRESVTWGKGRMSKVGPSIDFSWSLVVGLDSLRPMDLVVSLLETLETCLSGQRPAEGTAELKFMNSLQHKKYECRSFRGQPSLWCPQSVALLTYTEYVWVSMYGHHGGCQDFCVKMSDSAPTTRGQCPCRVL